MYTVVLIDFSGIFYLPDTNETLKKFSELIKYGSINIFCVQRENRTPKIKVFCRSNVISFHMYGEGLQGERRKLSDLIKKKYIISVLSYLLLLIPPPLKYSTFPFPRNITS